MAAPGVAVYGIQGALAPAGFPLLARAAADAAAPLPPPPPPPARARTPPRPFDGTQADIDLIQPPGPAGYPIPGYAMPYTNYEILSQHLEYYYSMTPVTPVRGAPGAAAAGAIPPVIATERDRIRTAMNAMAIPAPPPPAAGRAAGVPWNPARIGALVSSGMNSPGVQATFAALAPGAPLPPAFTVALLAFIRLAANQTRVNRGLAYFGFPGI